MDFTVIVNGDKHTVSLYPEADGTTTAMYKDEANIYPLVIGRGYSTAQKALKAAERFLIKYLPERSKYIPKSEHIATSPPPFPESRIKAESDDV